MCSSRHVSKRASKVLDVESVVAPASQPELGHKLSVTTLDVTLLVRSLGRHGLTHHPCVCESDSYLSACLGIEEEGKVQEGVLSGVELDEVVLRAAAATVSRVLEEDVAEAPHEMASGINVKLSASSSGALAAVDLGRQNVTVGGLRTGGDASLPDLSAVGCSAHQVSRLSEALEAEESA